MSCLAPITGDYEKSADHKIAYDHRRAQFFDSRGRPRMCEVFVDACGFAMATLRLSICGVFLANEGYDEGDLARFGETTQLEGSESG